MLRKAQEKDIPRIAEILIFTKRHTYRDIFKNDFVSFNEMQVVKEAQYIQENNLIKDMYVYDDGIIKAVITKTIKNNELTFEDFYVDNFFQKQGIGKNILDLLYKEAKEKNCKMITMNVLDANINAIKFYEKFGYTYSNIKNEYFDSGKFLLKYEKACCD